MGHISNFWGVKKEEEGQIKTKQEERKEWRISKRKSQVVSSRGKDLFSQTKQHHLIHNNQYLCN